MRWGKLIDHDRCIGCHACSVACKQENRVPLGVFRTWVKTVEKGVFPDARRHFGVLRCNQCDDAPCVAICPVTAMFRRRDGIVDFDPDACVGCKACIQACPYDAIYMDPESHTAAKCHFCAHRIEVGLEPACVTACPERALLVGDLDDPASEVSRIVARHAVSVRKPELGTRPKVFYKGADGALLDPFAAARSELGMWSRGRALPLYESGGGDGGRRASAPPVAPATGAAGATPAATRPGRTAAARVAYDVPREGTPWGWKISAYLFAKSLGAGALAVGGTALVLGDAPGWLERLAAPALALVALAVTSLLLVADLRRPERFLRILTRPQWGSWLVRGSLCLLAATAGAAAWLGLGLAAPPVDASRLAWRPLRLTALFSAAAAIPCAAYTAWLFAQCRGRAFWQSPLLPVHLLVQAGLAGAATLGGVAALAGLPWAPYVAAVLVLLGLHWLAIASELHLGAGPEDARLAARAITHGRLSWAYSALVGLPREATVLLGAASIVLEGPLAPWSAAAACLSALVGLAAWEHLYVVAGQDPPLS